MIDMQGQSYGRRDASTGEESRRTDPKCVSINLNLMLTSSGFALRLTVTGVYINRGWLPFWHSGTT